MIYLLVFLTFHILHLSTAMKYNEMRLLIVDDISATRRVIITLLRKIGITDITEATNGQEGWDILQEQTFDLVLCDLAMPVMDGFGLLEKIRSDAKLSDLPFIMITASDDQKAIIKAIKGKVSQYIVKPFKKEILQEKIDKVMSNNIE